MGYGPYSESLTVTTAVANQPPKIPFNAPKVQASSTHECTAIELHLSELRTGCNGDERLNVEMTDGGAWLPAAEGVKARTTTITSLDPYVAYRFRITAANTVGVSAPGPETVPLLTDNEHTKEHAKIGDAPSVVATSSASMVITWTSSPCRPQLTWELLYSRHGASPVEWKTIVKGLSSSSYEVQSLRCPTGCSFRVRPLEVRGLADPYSKPSNAVRTKVLPRAPSNSVRLELKLTTTNILVGGSADPREALANQITSDLANGLGVSTSRIKVVEVRGDGLFFIFDVLPGGKSTPTPKELTDELVRSMKNAQSQLFAGVVTRAVDPAIMPLLVTHNGTVTPLVSDDGLSQLLATQITSAIVVLVCLIGAVTVLVRVLGSSLRAGGGSRQSQQANYKYGDVDGADDEDEWIEELVEGKGRKANDQ